MTEERLQKILARAGLGSRRSCETLIREGRVTVNGRIGQLGEKADPTRDSIRIDGSPVKLADSVILVALNKPRDVVSTDRPHPGDGRPTARSLIALENRLFAIGRLDAGSEGLMLFTNDGDLALRLTHPRYEHEKEYRVLVSGRPDSKALEHWRKGVMLSDGMTLPVQVKLIRKTSRATWLRVTMREGRKRQIRRVANELGYSVRRLVRERMGPIRLGALKPGEWRQLTEPEIASLRSLLHRKKRSSQRLHK